MKRFFGLVLFMFIANVLSLHAAQFTPTSTAGSQVDRYPPAVFNYVTDHFELGVAWEDGEGNRAAPYESAFYRIQGVFFSADSEGADWSVSTNVLITPDMLTTGLWRQDMAVRTGQNGVDDATSDYLYFNFKRFSPTNLFDKDAVDISVNWRVWNLEIADWHVLPEAPTAGVHNWRIEGNATSYSYYLDNVLVFSTNTVKFPQNLDTVFLQQYNLFSSAYPEDAGKMNIAEFQGLNYPIPEPSAPVLLAISLVLLTSLRRRHPFGASAPYRWSLS